MSFRYLTITLTLFAVTLLAAGDEPKLESISVDSLNEISVIGKLGIPLGTVATVRVTVVDGDSLRNIENDGTFLLLVTSVEGKKLDPAPVIDFENAPGADVELANETFDLYSLKNEGEKADGLIDVQITKLKDGYVGKLFHMKVYELGAFSGVARNMPDEAGLWAEHGFRFRTYLRVLCEAAGK